ncbi:MAG: hypothetical protein LBT59_09480 [Clostridiales bacterium]|jgi:hypothetical protein|nr:hypothetical protein [Clostridiales bacterium]
MRVIGISQILFQLLVHIPKFRIGAGKVLANASTLDFSGTSDIILGYAFNISRDFSCAYSVNSQYALSDSNITHLTRFVNTQYLIKTVLI